VVRAGVPSPDVLIVGGGLLGTATAYFARKAGLSVLLLEARDLAAGASGAAFGGVSVSIYSYASPRVPPPYVELSKASLALYHELAGELGPPLDFAAHGSLDPFFDEAAWPSRAERASSLQACGVPARVLHPEEVRAIEPAVSGPIAGATYCPVDGHVTPLNMVWALADGARRLGAEIRTGTPVTALTVDAGRVIGVRTAAGRIAARWIVDTAGAGAAALAQTAGVALPMSYSRGQMCVTERIPPLLRAYLHNIKQTAAGTVVIGATREPDVADTGTTVAGIRDVLAGAVRAVPALAGIRVVRTWAGVRPVPRDGYPVLGDVEGLDGVLLGVMHRGVSLAPAIGQALTDLMVTGTSRLDLAMFSLSRFAAAPPLPACAPEVYYARG
jgi:sarcosine oxidase subunit beta